MTDPVFGSAEAAHAIRAQYRQVLEQWPVPRTELMIQTREGQTFAVVSGPEDAPPLVLLHGSQANSAAWIPDVSVWSQRFRLYAIDLIGEPGLSAQSRPDLSTEAHALWLDDVLSELGLTDAIFVGTSLGGWLALDYANRRPNAVSALALICPSGIGRQKNFLLKALPLLLLGSWGKYKMREMIFGPAPESMLHELRPFAELMDRIAAVVRPRVLRIPQLTDEELQALRIPVLAIVGGRDVLLDSADTRDRLENNSPMVEVCFIEDGYHYLPDQTARVMAFLLDSASEN